MKRNIRSHAGGEIKRLTSTETNPSAGMLRKGWVITGHNYMKKGN